MASDPRYSTEDLQRMQQGCQIPCVDCKILHGPRADCAQCGGSGMHFQAAQMCDHSIQWSRGQDDRRTCDELRGAEAWGELAGAIRGCFVSHTIYGSAWAAGYLDIMPDLEDHAPERRDAIDEAWAALVPELKEEFFRARKMSDGGFRGASG